MLNRDGIEAAIAAQLSDAEDDDADEESRAPILRDALRRSRQDNLSFFAFTATPKFKTKVLFDEPGPSGEAPFHEYSMRKAIEEGFILDVLANYTTYKRFYGLIKQIEDDPEVPRKQAAKALTRFLELHPVNIEQVVSVIVEHFRLHVMHELGGRAKAMVVTGSRLAAVKYQTGFDQPLLQTMYVVERLAGVQAVQTLSRLNRVAPEKSRTFVLDFANEEDDIYQAFKPYLRVDPHRRERGPAPADRAALQAAGVGRAHHGGCRCVRASLVSRQAGALRRRAQENERDTGCGSRAIPRPCVPRRGAAALGAGDFSAGARRLALGQHLRLVKPLDECGWESGRWLKCDERQ